MTYREPLRFSLYAAIGRTFGKPHPYQSRLIRFLHRHVRDFRLWWGEL